SRGLPIAVDAPRELITAIELRDRLAARDDPLESERAGGAKEAEDLPTPERNTHEGSGDEVDGRGRSPRHEAIRADGRSSERTVAFHSDHAVDDAIPRRDRSAELDDGARNSIDVEHVLRPSVLCTGHDPHHVLHRERDARPMMSLQLRHAHDEICIHEYARER